MSVEIVQGDCRDVLELMPSASVHAVVTDPPYGLNFMGKSWDYDVPGVEVWRECLRVLKPGGHLLAFFGTRTYHRGVVAIEDAGFEIRDQIGWLYGSGFPKSSNQHGEWEGWGTALKPAWEPIVVARKPFSGTVPANLETWGVGALNIDGCRVGEDARTYAPRGTSTNANMIRVPEHRAGTAGAEVTVLGRWPANIIHDGSAEVLASFDAFGESVSRKGAPRGSKAPGEGWGMTRTGAEYNDSGSPARFFYCAKASRSDRDDGLDGRRLETVSDGRAVAADNAYQRGKTLRANTHPTVKPTELMRYLCRLITPPGGTVLDPFMGSGSTGRGAVLEGFNFIGIELDAQYAAIAQARIAAVAPEVDVFA